MLKVTIQFDDSADDLERAYDYVVALRDRHRAMQPTAPLPLPPPATALPAAWNVEGWFNHLGEGSRSFWEIAARYAQNHPTFTFDELATASGTDKETLRSYQRNSYRAIRGENAPDPLPEADWDANQGCNVYRMPDAVRDEILRLSA